MQIVAQSSDRLLLHESPWGFRAMGALMAGVGITTLVFMIRGGHSGEHNAWVAFLVGGAFAAIGIALLATAADREVLFDRITKSARVTRRGGVLRSTTTEVPFSSIRDIALESSTQTASARNTSASYRIVFVLRDGTRLPWTSLLTGDVGRQATCVAAARTFGGWDTAAVRSGAGSMEIARPTPAPGLQAVRAPTPGSVTQAQVPGRPATQNLGCVMAFLGLFTLIGGGMAVVQVVRLVSWHPSPATVITSHIDAVRGSKGGTSYRPSVIYSYEVGGRRYVSSSVTILNESAGWAWANRIINRYPPGAETVAYVDPGNPGKAYLVHDLSVVPFIFIFIPIAFGALVVFSVRWNARQAAVAAAVPVPVLPAQSIAPSKAA